MCNFTKTFVQPGYHWSPQGTWVYDPGQHRALGVMGLLTSHLWVPPRRGQAGLCRRAGIVISSPRLPCWPAVIEETLRSHPVWYQPLPRCVSMADSTTPVQLDEGWCGQIVPCALLRRS